MEYSYDIVLNGHMGERHGTLVWRESAGMVSGVLSLFGFEEPVKGKRSGQCLELKHTLRTAVSILDCTTVLTLEYDELSGIATSQYGQIRIRGKKAEERTTE